MSLDVLHGLTCFSIIGAEDLVHGLSQISDAPAVAFLVGQLTHKQWEGFAFYRLDLSPVRFPGRYVDRLFARQDPRRTRPIGSDPPRAEADRAPLSAGRLLLRRH